MNRFSGGLAGTLLGGGIASYFLGFGHSKPEPVQVEVLPPVAAFGTGGDPDKSTNHNSSVPVVPVKPGDFFKYGNPGPYHDVQFHKEFISCYDRRMRNPAWVIEHLTPESIARNGHVDRKYSIFKEDESIPLQFRARLVNYFRSGYDRGHQAPAADAKFSQEAMNETFYLTNIAPQVGEGFNRDYWAHFEDFSRRLVKKYNNVRIVTGPLYLPKKYPDGKFRVSYEVIGNPPNIAVPTHFFKLIVAENPINDPNRQEVAVEAFVLPNERISNATKLTEFVVPIEALESSSGLELLKNGEKNKMKSLCKEVDCSIIVREFQKSLPAPNQPLALPAPK